MTYVVKHLGVKGLFITNACGAINTNFSEGDIVCLDDLSPCKQPSNGRK